VNLIDVQLTCQQHSHGKEETSKLLMTYNVTRASTFGTIVYVQGKFIVYMYKLLTRNVNDPQSTQPICGGSCVH
jgi:hypothetical protein